MKEVRLRHMREAGIAEIGYRVDCQISSQASGKRFFDTPQRPDQLWGPFGLLFNGCWIFPWWYSGRSVKLTTRLYLVPI
jgi:hypothetical protein